MADKIKAYNGTEPGTLYVFHCPGCGYDHGFWVGRSGRPCWSFNDNMESPTFDPSLLCNKDTPEQRCHSFVRNGRIEFLSDCFHNLKGQTVDLPDY